MKRRTLASMLFLAAAVAIACMFLRQPLFASATVVSGPCFYDDGAGSLWEGQGTFIQSASGQINGGCHASLVSGPGVAQITHVQFIGGTPFGPAPYSGVLTPSGNAELFIRH